MFLVFPGKGKHCLISRMVLVKRKMENVFAKRLRLPENGPLDLDEHRPLLIPELLVCHVLQICIWFHVQLQRKPQYNTFSMHCVEMKPFSDEQSSLRILTHFSKKTFLLVLSNYITEE